MQNKSIDLSTAFEEKLKHLSAKDLSKYAYDMIKPHIGDIKDENIITMFESGQYINFKLLIKQEKTALKHLYQAIDEMLLMKDGYQDILSISNHLTKYVYKQTKTVDKAIQERLSHMLLVED